MTDDAFTPTAEQDAVVRHKGPAFVVACPGAGKTRVMVERSQTILRRGDGRGIAFLSFTRAAVSELERRLRHAGLLASPPFPHFIGTFDSFLWANFLAPFGVPGFAGAPRLIPDIDDRSVRPFPNARELPLSCFDRETGLLIAEAARRYGFAPPLGQQQGYQTVARRMRERFRGRGEVSFDDVRAISKARLAEPALSARLAPVVAARYAEVIVDEAQDCSGDDLDIIKWICTSGSIVKIICDPDQSIYAFRGGVTEQLLAFRATFPPDQQLRMTGNFRSSQTICNAVTALRPAATRGEVDRALGPHKDVQIPVYLLTYQGSVRSEIGSQFRTLIERHGLSPSESPVVAKTAGSCSNAAGQPYGEESGYSSCRLAAAVCGFHHAVDGTDRSACIERVHAIVLEVEGHLGEKTYKQFIASGAIEPDSWRPRILQLIAELRYTPERFATPQAWLERARALLQPSLLPGGRSIAQRLPMRADLGTMLSTPPATLCPGRTVHSVKGLEFPAVCVVLTSTTAGRILDYIERGQHPEMAEEARILYVGASRAMQLLAIAVPQSQKDRLASLLGRTGTLTETLAI